MGSSKAYCLLHKEEIKAYKHKLYMEHQDIYKRREHIKHREIKTEVLTHYGDGKCACIRCGFSNISALSIDHINGGGAAHRRALGVTSGTSFYYWLKKGGYPEGYQTLCMNCQYIKRDKNGEWLNTGRN